MLPIFEHFADGKTLYEKMVLPVCRQFDLTHMEFTVLMFLQNNPQYDTAAQIARVRQLTKSHVSVSLKSLQERGLVEGIYFPGNQRKVHLRLTAKAEPVVKAGFAAQAAFGARLVQGFTAEEIELLRILLERMHNNMKQEESDDARE